MAQLTYGSVYRLQNGYQSWLGGYLDTRGHEDEHQNLLAVSTALFWDRDKGSGCWQILSVSGKNAGEPVMDGDSVYLQNQYPEDPTAKGGFLDTRGMANNLPGSLLCVSTAESCNYNGLSGTWRIMKDTPGGPVLEGDMVRFLNGYWDFEGGYLDTRNWASNGNLINVYTSTTPDRDTGSTHWRFSSVPAINVRIPSLFHAIPADGKGIDFSGTPYGNFDRTGFYDLTTPHVQGFAIATPYLFLTKNRAPDGGLDPRPDRGYLIIMSTANGMRTICQVLDTPELGMAHPGGIQQCDGILALSLENGDFQPGPRSVIRFYSLQGMNEWTPPTLLDNIKIERPDRKAGAVGITSRQEGSTRFTYVAVYDGATGIDVYKSNGQPLNPDSPCSFNLLFNMSMPLQPGGDHYGADNLNLFADDACSQIFMIGFRSIDDPPGCPCHDYADLYCFDPANIAMTGQVGVMTSRHFTTHGDLPGALGAHFRYGAGADLMKSGFFSIWSAQRNITTFPSPNANLDETVDLFSSDAL